MQQLFYTVDEAAPILRVSRSHLYTAVKAGEVRSVKIGRRILIPKSVVEEMAGLNGGVSFQ